MSFRVYFLTYCPAFGLGKRMMSDVMNDARDRAQPHKRNSRADRDRIKQRRNNIGCAHWRDHKKSVWESMGKFQQAPNEPSEKDKINASSGKWGGGMGWLSKTESRSVGTFSTHLSSPNVSQIMSQQLALRAFVSFESFSAFLVEGGFMETPSISLRCSHKATSFQAGGLRRKYLPCIFVL